MVDGAGLDDDVLQEILDRARAQGALSHAEIGAMAGTPTCRPRNWTSSTRCWARWAWRSAEADEEELEDFSEEEEFLELLDVTIDHTVDDPVRMYLREIGQDPLAHVRAGDGAGQAHREEGRGGQAQADRGQPAAGGLHRQAIHGAGPGVPGPHPGGQPGAHPRGGEVRLPAGLQVLDLRHLVDPPGHHSGHRRSGAHHPGAGARCGDHEQDEPGAAGVAAEQRPRADRGRRSPRRWA